MNYDQWRHTLRGILLEWLRQPERAIAAYQDSYRANPRHVASARGVAWLHARGQRWDEAADWFQRALEIEPEHADTWFNLGYALEQTGDRERAIEAHRRATELNPQHDRAWYGLGMAHAHLGDHAAAAQALAEAARLQPMNGAAWYALGMAQHHCHQPDQVKATIEHTALLDPQAAKRLIQDTERADLAHLVAHL